MAASSPAVQAGQDSVHAPKLAQQGVPIRAAAATDHICHTAQTDRRWAGRERRGLQAFRPAGRRAHHTFLFCGRKQLEIHGLLLLELAQLQHHLLLPNPLAVLLRALPHGVQPIVICTSGGGT